MMRDPRWHKSSYSSPQGGACIEVAGINNGRAVRDSKNPAGPVLTCTTTNWSAFTAAIRSGEFD